MNSKAAMNPTRIARTALPSRRQAAAALLAVPWIWSVRQARAATPLRPTPSQTEGPFYPVELPADSDHDLLQNGSMHYSQGTPAWIEGRLLDPGGQPVAGAQVEIWQCDQHGSYHHPRDRGRADPAFQGFGRVSVGADGGWRFRTIRPAPYAGRTPHIHLKARLGRHELLTTQLYVEGEPGNAGDFLWRRLDEHGRRVLTRPFVPGPDGLRASYELVVTA